MLAELRPEVAAVAADCPNPVIDRAIIDAARELCRSAPLWQRVITLEDTAAGDVIALSAGLDELYGAADTDLASHLPHAWALLRQTHAVPALVNDGELVRVLSLTVNGRSFRAYRMRDFKTIHIGRDPGADVDVSLAIAPKTRAKKLPDVLSFYRDALVAGALSRVLKFGAWANADLAVYYGRAFRAERANAIAQVRRGFTQSGVSANKKRFASFREASWI